MTVDKIIVFISGLIGIISTYWFFLWKKEEVVQVKNAVDIVVDGGYTPNQIVLEKGKSSILTFIRKDSNSCLEEIRIPDFKIKSFLPMQTPVSFTLTPETSGEFEFVCGMNMYHGKIIVRD